MKKTVLSAVLGFAVLAVVMMLVALGYDRLQERQTRYLYIADALTPLPEKADLVQWDPAEVALDRPVLPGDEVRIGQAMAEAWQAVAMAQATGETDLLSVRLSGVAEGRARLAAAEAQASNTRMVVLSQRAMPVFFHQDGSMFQAEVEMEVARFALSETGLTHFSVTRDQGVATLMNESNGWRLYSYERRSAAPMKATGPGWKGQILGLNYYPAQTPWRAFWPNFDAALIDADFERLAGLGANSVRVFLPRDVFAAADGVEKPLDDLRKMLALAKARGLTVAPTLFDMRGGYGVETWAADVLVLERVLPVLAASDAVSFVDLKNEPDLDFAIHGEGLVLAWLGSMIEVARRIAPDLPLTVGWAKVEAGIHLSDDLDLISYHDYAPIEGAADRLANLRKQVGTKPVVITEIGSSSYGWLFGWPGSERKQAKALQARLDALKGSDGVMIWTLYDFPAVDALAVGARPWIKRQQAAFGVLRADGAEKPAAQVLREAFAGGPEG